MPNVKVAMSTVRNRLGVSLAGVLALGLGAVGLVGLPASPASAAPSGPTWSTQLVPLPANANATAEANVAVTTCPAPGNCTAAGTYLDASGNFVGMFETQSNGVWSVTPAPMPPNPKVGGLGPFWESISCGAVGSCTVVGSYQDTGDFYHAEAATLAGGVWTLTLVPLPANMGTDGDTDAYSELDHVSCTTVSSCVAVGTYVDNDDYSYALISVESAGSWTSAASPLPGNAGTDGTGTAGSHLYSVDCPADGQCVAVGQYDTVGSNDLPLVATLSGGSWSALTGPLPANAAFAQEAELNDVSCAAPTDCVAVGDYDDTSNNEFPTIDTLASGSWTAIAAPLPPGAGTDAIHPESSLAGVSCPTSDGCVAVGQYDDSNHAPYGLIDVLSGSTWTPSQAAQPANSGTGIKQLGRLAGVSCSWPGQCVLTGYYQDNSDHDHAMIISITGGSMTTMEAPYAVPPSTTDVDSFAEDVSCVAAMCALGVDFDDVSNHTRGSIVTFQGSGGYDLSASDGGIFAYNSPFFGSMGGMPLNKPVVGITVDPATDGYFEVASDGGMFAFNAPFQGSMGGQPLNQPVVGMAFDTRTGGYYEVASDGGLFAFNAPFYGSMGGMPLNKPIVGISFDPQTGGYYEVASDGGLFAFNAPFLGSMGGMPLNEPVVGMAFNSVTDGYYEVASDGGLFAFGAPFLGSTGNITLNKPVVGMTFDPYANGYYEVATDGGIFAYGTPFWGSTGAITLNEPVVGMGTT